MGAIAKVKIENEMKMFVGQRKHVSQMSQYEISSLLKRVRAIRPREWKMSYHALDRLVEKNIKTTPIEVASTMYNCEVIEYKIDEKPHGIQERVVVRAKSIVNKRYNIHVVYNLTNGVIITVWMNNINDKHSTLDWSLYNRDMKVFNI